MNANQDVSRTMIEKLTTSTIYQQYESSFNHATGLPLRLRPVELWQLPHHKRRNENRFCALMAGKSRSCAACLQMHQKLADAAYEQSCSMTCPHGLTDTAVPVRQGDRIVGFLQTGQVFRKAPTEAQFERTTQFANAWGLDIQPETLREAYFSTPVVEDKKYKSVTKLLSIFAQHLGLVLNRIMVEQQNSELPVITKAKDYIQQNHTEDLSLWQVAQAVHTSPYYFCKLFKRTTGLAFTHYVSRVRIEKAKNLLLNPNLRVSEIAYEIGFQSLTHFNRVFKKFAGHSPSKYRAQLKA